jgi:hypothetical protein
VKRGRFDSNGDEHVNAPDFDAASASDPLTGAAIGSTFVKRSGPKSAK